MKLKLVEDWRRAHKWLSIKIPAIGTAAFTAYAAMPERFQQAIPTWVIVTVAIVFLVAGMFGRVVHQPKAK